MIPEKPRRIGPAWLILCCLFVHPSAFGASSKAIDPDSERFMELILHEGRNILTSALPIYRVKGSDTDRNRQDQEWYFPLAEYSDALGLSIQVSAATGDAEGFVISESRRFKLSLTKCSVEHDGKSESFPCGDIVAYRDDIWVPARLMAQWLPVTITSVDLLASRISITPREKLPLQARLDRERQASRFSGEGRVYDPGYPRVKIPHTLLEGPFLDPSLQVGRLTSGGSASYQFLYNANMSGEFMGLETLAYFGGDNLRPFDAGRLSLMRRDRDGGLLGPLGARQIQIFDVDFSSIPLLTAGTSGRGFVISSAPLEAPTTFERNDFRGPLPQGWEVVLYRNEMLIGRQVSNKDGRYNFENIQLLYGKNVFRLTFFGPHGEQRDEYKTFDITSTFIAPGANQYRFGWIMTPTREQKLGFVYTQNVHKFLNVTTGFLHTPGQKNTALSLGLMGVNEIFLFTTTCALSEDGGKACEWGAQTGFGNTTLGAKHTRLFNFRSDLFQTDDGQTAETTANLGFTLWSNPGIATNFELLRRDFLATRSTTTLRNRVSLGLGSVSLNHEANFDFKGASPYTGILDVQFNTLALRSRIEAGYLPSRLNTITAEVELSPSEYTIGMNVQYLIPQRTVSFGINANLLFEDFTLGTALTFRDGRNYGINVRTSFSLQRDPRQESWQFRRELASQTGAASVRVYRDLNRNGEFDGNDVPLKEIYLAVNQQEMEATTNDAGYLFIPSLLAHNPVDISVSDRSFRKNPFLKPTQRGVRIFPRAGKTARLDFPIVTVGMIDGTVSALTDEGDLPKRGIHLELVDAKGAVLAKAKTDRYGIYSFEDIVPGEYTLRIASDQLRSLGFKSDPASQPISIPEDGDILNGIDFHLKK